MKFAFVVRKYQNDDKECCRSLWRELTEWHRKIYQDPRIGGEHPEDYFDKHLSKVGSDNLWVAVHGNKAVGFVGLIVEGYEAEMEPIIVSKACRGKGIGTKLVETVVSEARKRGVGYLDVKPVARNVETIKFFQKIGFKNVGHVDLFIDFSNRTWKRGLKIHDCEFNY
jgi:ribosomal protein S18 acetylase RimI-like enzyme